jgi:large subunit ribosomal protein L13
MEKKEYLIDAQGKRLGRLATEIASILIGKNRVDFVKYKAPEVEVKIVNARLMDVSEKKASQETYQTYSGHPGGRKVETLGHLAGRRGYAEVIRRTVKGMLPKNRLTDVRMKNLTINE